MMEGKLVRRLGASEKSISRAGIISRRVLARNSTSGILLCLSRYCIDEEICWGMAGAGEWQALGNDRPPHRVDGPHRPLTIQVFTQQTGHTGQYSLFKGRGSCLFSGNFLLYVIAYCQPE